MLSRSVPRKISLRWLSTATTYRKEEAQARQLAHQLAFRGAAMPAPSGASLLKKTELDQLPFLFSIYALNSNFRNDLIQLQVDNEAAPRTPESTWGEMGH